MRFSVVKRAGLKTIAAGIRPPEGMVNRYQELVQLRCLLRTLQINCVIDVGANTGQFASELRAFGYEGHLCCIEPVKTTYRILESNFEGDSKWRGYQLALGATNTRMTINVNPAFTQISSFLSPREDWAEKKKEDVEVRRLDDLFEEIVAPVSQPRVLLKMDTQGYDLQVFEGAGACVERIHGLQSELSVLPFYDGMTNYLDALAIYQRAGFQLFNLSVLSRDGQGRIEELNCFLSRHA